MDDDRVYQIGYKQGKDRVIQPIQEQLDLLNASDMSGVNLYSFACKVYQIIVEARGEE